MIVISEDQLDQVEYLIDQSLQGNHILFDPCLIREIFHAGKLHRDLPIEKAYEVEPHIERLISLPTLAQKKAYVEKLDRDTVIDVIKTYFNIVENNLYENSEVRH